MGSVSNRKKHQQTTTKNASEERVRQVAKKGQTMGQVNLDHLDQEKWAKPSKSTISIERLACVRIKQFLHSSCQF